MDGLLNGMKSTLTDLCSLNGKYTPLFVYLFVFFSNVGWIAFASLSLRFGSALREELKIEFRAR